MHKSKKREFLGEVMNSVAHDMNEGISGIFNYLDQIDEDLKEGAEDIEFLEIETIRNKIKIIKKEFESFSGKIKSINSFFDEQDSFEVNERSIDELLDQVKYYNSKNLMKKGITLNINSNISEDCSVIVSEPMIIFLVKKLIQSVSSKVTDSINLTIDSTPLALEFSIPVSADMENVFDLDLVKEVKELKTMVDIENLPSLIKLKFFVKK